MQLCCERCQFKAFRVQKCVASTRYLLTISGRCTFGKSIPSLPVISIVLIQRKKIDSKYLQMEASRDTLCGSACNFITISLVARFHRDSQIETLFGPFGRQRPEIDASNSGTSHSRIPLSCNMQLSERRHKGGAVSCLLRPGLLGSDASSASAPRSTHKDDKSCRQFLPYSPSLRAVHPVASMHLAL